MKLALIGEFHGNPDEGAHVYFRSLSRGYSEIGVDVHEFEPSDRLRGVQLLNPRFLQRLRRGSFDVVQYIPKSGLTHASLARTAWLSARLHDSLVYGTFLQADEAPFAPRFPIRSRALVISQATRALLARRGWNVRTSGVGVDTERYNAHGRSDSGLWPAGEGMRFLHVGHLKRGRNLQVIAELARRGHRCLVIASTSTDPEPEVVRELKGSGVAVVDTFITDLASIYRAADAYIFPVLDARSAIAVPLSVLEAAACGTPVISTDFGALREHLPSNASVRIVAPDRLLSEALEPQQRSGSTTFRSWADVARQNVGYFARDAKDSRGRIVVLVGVDGSGKSTQAEMLRAAAGARGLNAVVVWGRWDPRFLGPAMSLFRRVGERRDPAGDEDRVSGLQRKRKWFRLPFMKATWRALSAADYAASTLPKIAAARRSADLVIVDRYFPDALVDLAVNFGEPSVTDGPFRWFPKPAQVVVLDTPEEVALSRKADIPSRSYIAERRPRYARLAEERRWPVVSTGSRGREDVAREIEKLVFHS